MLNILDNFGGIACHDSVWRHVLCYHGIGTDDATVAEVYAWQDGGSISMTPFDFWLQNYEEIRKPPLHDLRILLP